MPWIMCYRCKKSFGSKDRNMYRNVSNSAHSYLQDKLVEDNVNFSDIGPIYLCSACERNYQRRSKEKQQHEALVLLYPRPMNTEQSKQNSQLQKCWRIPYQYGCFICGALLSNNSVLVLADVRLIYSSSMMFIFVTSSCVVLAVWLVRT